MAILWSLRHRLMLIGVVLMSACGLLAYQLFIQLPEWETTLTQGLDQQQTVWVRGKIQRAHLENNEAQLHLIAVDMFASEQETELHEIFVTFPTYPGRQPRFFRQRHIQISGTLNEVKAESQRLHLSFAKAHFHDVQTPESAFQRRRSSFHARLVNRAQFYLSEKAASLYLPVTLANSVYLPEVRNLFSETGVSHLLAISGLHIALIYGMVLWGLQSIGGRVTQWMLWPYFIPFSQTMTLIGLWGYIFLLGFPLPALRAVCMLSLWVVIRWSGQQQHPLYLLFLTALGFMIQQPTTIYDVSFQLSFMAVFYILLFARFLSINLEKVSLFHRMLHYLWASFVVTGSVSLGLWPILVSYFHAFSFEVFWLNLILIPLLGLVILPLCLIALLSSLVLLNEVPFHFLESWSFQLVEWGMQGWLWGLSHLHQWASWAQWHLSLEWEPFDFFLYYGSTGLLWYVLKRWQEAFRPHLRNHHGLQ
ncbi:ComEC/Rec2 family competence protein [Deltaproteobacteria bacterium TL4]